MVGNRSNNKFITTIFSHLLRLFYISSCPRITNNGSILMGKRPLSSWEPSGSNYNTALVFQDVYPGDQNSWGWHRGCRILGSPGNSSQVWVHQRDDEWTSNKTTRNIKIREFWANSEPAIIGGKHKDFYLLMEYPFHLCFFQGMLDIDPYIKASWPQKFVAFCYLLNS